MPTISPSLTWAALALPTLAASAVAQSPSVTADSGAPDLQLRSVTIVVRQYEEAKAWYTRQLGFVVVRDQAFGSGQRFLLVAPPGTPGVGFVLEKARRDDPAMPMDYSDRVGKEVNIVLATSDLTRLAQVLQRRGVRFRQPPRQQPWGGEAVIEDLYGNTFVLVGPIRSGSATSDSVATAGK